MKKRILAEILLLLIITIPAFTSILNNQFFSMHDDQHIARLYLLDLGLKQGTVYPRWVDNLGFGYGYPLFNFYPPLVYYISEIFHLFGLSLVWSIKMTFILGFFLSSLGVFLFIKRRLSRMAAFMGAIFYTYFLYHSINIYVRGALAEFFSMSVLPFVFLSIDYLTAKLSLKRSIFFGITLALLILTHPLIAFPSLIFIGLFILFKFMILKNKKLFLKYILIGALIGLSLSSFFWLPSMTEKKYTLVDSVLTKELASYKIHYIYPSQFLYSNWGYGGSLEGPNDGMSFQLGKIFIFSVILTILLSVIYLIKNKKINLKSAHFYLYLVLLLLSLFMSTSASSFIWDNVKYLWYLQFPWRFLSFVQLFIALISAYLVFFLENIFTKPIFKKYLLNFVFLFFGLFIIFHYQKYFHPEKLIKTNDTKLTSFNEIVWRISRSSFEFMPKGVKTVKSELNTTIPNIKFENLPKSIYSILSGKADLRILQNKFAEKKFLINTDSGVKFRLNNYYFPGWQAYVDHKKVKIDDDNNLKLITIEVPKGSHELTFIFEDTKVRKFANLISLISFISLVCLLLPGLLRRFASRNDTRNFI